MGIADLHLHTNFSRDGTSSVESMVRYAARKAKMDVIAVTDHDVLAGAQRAAELGPVYGIEVVVGCEITTREGHLLGLFMQEAVSPGLSLVESVLRVGEQGGLCIVPHPMARNTWGVSEVALRNALRDPEVQQILVGLEVFNAGVFYRQTNAAARRLARFLDLPGIGASDAHLPWMIGGGATAFLGHTALELRSALESGAVLVLEQQVFRRTRISLDWLRRSLFNKIVKSFTKRAKPIDSI
jgi:predicted metal-dependent phosphoesterase TrpH